MALRVRVVFAHIARAVLSYYFWRHGCVDYFGRNMLNFINYVFIVLIISSCFSFSSSIHYREHPNEKVPYHYYDPEFKSECSYYHMSEVRLTSGHLFITEKAVFARWANIYNIHFLHPKWDPKPYSLSGTLRTPFLQRYRIASNRLFARYPVWKLYFHFAGIFYPLVHWRKDTQGAVLALSFVFRQDNDHLPLHSLYIYYNYCSTYCVNCIYTNKQLWISTHQYYYKQTRYRFALLASGQFVLQKTGGTKRTVSP